MKTVKKQDQHRIGEVLAEFKDPDGLVESLSRALEPFGIEVVDDPRLDGSDMLGFLVVDKGTTKKEIEEYVAD